MAKIELPRRQARVVDRIVNRWLSDGTIDDPTAKKLSDSFYAASFDWRRLARLSVITAVICIIVAVVAVFSDKRLLAWVARVFSAPEIAKFIFFAILACLFYVVGYRRHQSKPERLYTNEGLYLLAVLGTGAAIYYLGRAIDDGSGHFSLLILLSCLVYGAIAIFVRSSLIWLFALISLGGWFGAETGYASGWGAYYLGMNYPVRFVLFGAVLCVVSYSVLKNPRTGFLFQTTYVMGLVYLFVALWLLSIFGNYGDGTSWRAARQIELFHWSLIFAAVAGLAIWHGLKFDNVISRGFGLTFLFINIYTRFFEHFWDSIHKAAFFVILGISLWFLGSKAQTIWNLGRKRGLDEEAPT